ncbi:hypothetical protein ebA3196 [Aromatoleum aromaticum EbN1]|uniref:Uncharacterized protein n=1 Tax=Aromatoleum aromaticum (strain DSM 19018 / LMG 30748 / EbN1) TaxID=76114 RepID=Q5P439_AROAE|nr:hypothetical protein ebA3196 [Aromatoleum aromaticum EbN1]
MGFKSGRLLGWYYLRAFDGASFSFSFCSDRLPHNPFYAIPHESEPRRPP